MLSEYSKKIKKALEYEKKQNFINSKGINSNFSEFILEQTNNYIKINKNDDLEKIISQFINYKDISIEERKRIIFNFENLLNYLFIEEKKNKIIIKSWKNIDVREIKGIGDKISQNLYKHNIKTLKDLLYLFPTKHLDYSQKKLIKDCKEDDNITIFGTILKVDIFIPPNNSNLMILNLTISDSSGKIKATYFYTKSNKYMQEQYKRRFPLNSQAIISGKVKKDKYSNKFVLDSPEIEIIDNSEISNLHNIRSNKIIPVYPLIEGLNLKWFRKIIKIAIDTFFDEIKDPLPNFLIKELALLSLNEAIKEFHFPSNIYSLKKARYRLVFDELFYMQLSLLYRRKQEELYIEGTKFNIESNYINKFLSNLEFKLTNAQKKVFKEISLDLSSPKPMRRLIQGDVGSGKTIIALLSALICIENGYQVAIMAPTEILSEQHYKKFKNWLSFMNIEIELLNGSMTKKSKKIVLEKVLSGETNIIIGTHSLIQDNVNFKNLGLVIIDEQHRFGVMQRAELINKGKSSHLLSMTATPIPRTLALTLYGDLDISIVDELPPGRKPVDTYLINNNNLLKKVWNLITDQLIDGRQAYIVFPLVEESEKLELKAAIEEHIYLQKEIFPKFRVGLLHGQMKSSEKDEIMNKFSNREIDILVSTTVIEVGIDVPNSTIMVIENAERFGLSQLHQLRGRVGRGSNKSYCFLISNKNKERLEIMTKTNDGFVLSEHDLRLRGPGEFIGTRQSGIPDLVLSNLSSDTEILDKSRKYAMNIINLDNSLEKFKSLKEQIIENYYKNSFVSIS